MYLEKLLSGMSARRLFRAVMWCLMAAVVPVAMAEPVSLQRDSALRAQPSTDAAVVTNLPAGTNGEALARQGVWVQVKSGDATGWLYSFNLRFGASGAPGGESGGGAVLGRVIGTRQPLNVTATLGIRGLEEEDLKQARFDGQQLQQLDGFAASREQAEAHAAESGLSASRVEYLASPVSGPAESERRP